MPSRFRFRRALPLLFALLAFTGLLERGAMPLAAPAPGAGTLGILAGLGATICHTDPGGDPAPVHRHAPDCALCPVCQLQAPAAQWLHPAPSIVLAAPFPHIAAAYTQAEARAPPATAWRPARPRGPPTLV